MRPNGPSTGGRDDGVDLDTSVGYLLKVASSALRTSMEGALRPLGMTVTHNATLELLAQRPGLSGDGLARGRSSPASRCTSCSRLSSPRAR